MKTPTMTKARKIPIHCNGNSKKKENRDMCEQLDSIKLDNLYECLESDNTESIELDNTESIELDNTESIFTKEQRDEYFAEMNDGKD
jgi:hypothetical protein